MGWFVGLLLFVGLVFVVVCLFGLFVCLSVCLSVILVSCLVS